MTEKIKQEILEYCKKPRTRSDMYRNLDFSNEEIHYTLRTLIETRKIEYVNMYLLQTVIQE